MPIHKIPETDLEYALISYDRKGNERPESDSRLLSAELRDQIRSSDPPYTDVFILSHGWKGDLPAARSQYEAWSKAMALCTADRERIRQRVPGFRGMLIGFHWPSLPWGDESAGGSFAADGHGGGEKAFVAKWSERIADTPAAGDALKVLFAAAKEDIEPARLPSDVVAAYHTLDREAGLAAVGPVGPPDADREPFDPQIAYEAWRDVEEQSFADGGLGSGLLSVLRQLSFWTMKKRARSVGEEGGHALINLLATAREGIAGAKPVRIHVMGHSFGCIVTSGMLRGSDAKGASVASAMLVQGAMSLWSYSSTIPKSNGSGYFHPVFDRRCVKGPMVVTTSRFDKAVGTLYPIAAGAASQVEYSNELPLYGAIGAFGLQGVNAESLEIAPDLNYDYGMVAGRIYNLNCDAIVKKLDGLSGAHSDISHPELGHAFWSAVLASPLS